ncbi:MAG: peptidylprolyl isomerase [Bacteroidota bacterium]
MKRTFFCFILTFILMKCYSQSLPDQSMLMSHAPPRFQAVFITTKGNFTLEVYRDWSPLAADRLYQLLATGFFNHCGLFRVQKGYVVQFGIGDNKEINTFWDKRPVADEPVLTSNVQGTISYARDGSNSRTAQLFINLNNNHKLDTINFNGLRGFPPVAKIISGFDVVESFYPGYGFEPANHQDSVMICGNSYLKKKFPLLDFIIETQIREE